MPRTFRNAARAALAAAALSCSLASPAGAGVLVASAPECDTPDTARVFAPWADPISYFLAPDGGLEDGGSGWSLAGASVVAGNSSHAVSGPGASALSLPAGASATSPTVCLGLERPTMRFFVRSTGDSPRATLRVESLVEDAFGNVVAVPMGLTGGSGSWSPSPNMVVAASLTPLLPGAHTPVAFRFVAEDGSFEVDDVHVDPYGSR